MTKKNEISSMESSGGHRIAVASADMPISLIPSAVPVYFPSEVGARMAVDELEKGLLLGLSLFHEHNRHGSNDH